MILHRAYQTFSQKIKRNFLEAYLPFLIINKIVLIALYSPKGNLSDGIIVMTKFDKIYGIFSIFLQSFQFYIGLIDNYRNTKIVVLDFGNYLFKLLSIIYLFFTTLTSFMYQKCNEERFRLLAKFDKTVSYLNLIN